MGVAVLEDRISELPSIILHKIQWRLPLEDSTRTSVLSKYWNSVWKSNPKLYFIQSNYMKQVDKTGPAYQERVKEFLNFVDTSLRTFVQTGLTLSTVSLSLESILVDSVPLIDSWFPLVLRNGASELVFRAQFDGRLISAFPILKTAFSINASAGFSKFINPQSLSLIEVRMSEKIIRDICQNCPNIVDILFRRIFGVKTMKISKLDKLKSVKTELGYENSRISIDASSLQRFTCINYMPTMCNMITCHALKSLNLQNSRITDEEISTLMSKFPCLETLEIILCQVLKRFRISHLRLKFLTIYHCRGIESIFVDAPTLSKFTYGADIVKFPLLSSNIVRSDVDFIYKLGAPHRIVLDNSKFVELRRFLGTLTLLTYLEISLSSNEVSFDLKSVGESESPTLLEVDRLDLGRVKYMDESDCAALLEGLLWTCHPKIISFLIDDDDDIENNLQKVLYEKLLRCEERSCCNGCRSKCWHNSLKAAKIDFSGAIFADDQSKEVEFIRQVWDPLPMAKTSKCVRFLLEWDYGKPKCKRKLGKLFGSDPRYRQTYRRRNTENFASTSVAAAGVAAAAAGREPAQPPLLAAGMSLGPDDIAAGKDEVKQILTNAVDKIFDVFFGKN